MVRRHPEPAHQKSIFVESNLSLSLLSLANLQTQSYAKAYYQCIHSKMHQER